MQVLRRCAAAVVLSLMALAVGAPTQSRAQDYPTRPLTIIVPVTAGGAIDYLARLVGGKLSERLGQPVVVENKPGAGMVVGAVAAAKAPADGYTMLIATSTTLAINVTLHKSLPYDPLKDFVPVAQIANSPFTLVVNPSLPVNSVADLIKLAKEKPGQLSYASAGPGTPQQLFAELVKTDTGIAMTHVPYRGNVPAMTDLVAGHVQVMFSDPSGVPLIKQGKARPLGVSSSTRVEILPDVPPLAEVGLPGFDAVAWVMIVLPAGSPLPIVNRLNAELKAIVAMPDIRQAMARNALLPVETAPPAALQKYIGAEIERWGKVVKQAGIAGSL